MLRFVWDRLTPTVQPHLCGNLTCILSRKHGMNMFLSKYKQEIARPKRRKDTLWEPTFLGFTPNDLLNLAEIALWPYPADPKANRRSPVLEY